MQGQIGISLVALFYDAMTGCNNDYIGILIDAYDSKKKIMLTFKINLLIKKSKNA